MSAAFSLHRPVRLAIAAVLISLAVLAPVVATSDTPTGADGAGSPEAHEPASDETGRGIVPVPTDQEIDALVAEIEASYGPRVARLFARFVRWWQSLVTGQRVGAPPPPTLEVPGGQQPAAPTPDRPKDPGPEPETPVDSPDVIKPDPAEPPAADPVPPEPPKPSPAPTPPGSEPIEQPTPEPPRPPAPAPPHHPPTDPPTPQPPQPSAPDPTPPARNEFRVTNGSGDSTSFERLGPPGAGSAHGVRIYCTISHFSHDDAIVFPNQPGAAHAHMFWGNTGSDAFSTGDSLLRTGNSSCEGGTNNRSSYWTPAVFNAAGEVVLPESVFVYYKTFGGPGFDRSTLQPIPNGLEMLATRQIPHALDADFRVSDSGPLELHVSFPTCLAVDGRGQPILSSGDNISHLSYPAGSSPSNCPASHPYRIPMLTYVLIYDLAADSGWSLSSDDGARAGSTLHADYIAAWDPSSMDILVECNITERRDCGFAGNRGQLPDRFFGPDGRRVYDHSVGLTANADRTPFGAAVTPYRHGHQGHGGSHGG